MKKLSRMSFVFFCLALFIMPGCDKDELIEQPIVASSPIIEVTISPETVNQGGSSTLVYTISNATNMKLNGKSITKMVDTLVYNDLQAEEVFDFEAKNENGTTTLNKKITVVPLQPKLPSITSLTADPPTLPIGGGITNITWTSNENTLSVVYDGISYPANWTLPVSVTADSTRLVFVALGSDGQRSSTILIRVEQNPPPPPPLTIKELMCLSSHLCIKKEYSYPEEEEWVDIPISSCDQDDLMTFYPNYSGILDRGENLCGSVRYFEFSWTLEGNTFMGYKEITYIDSTKMIWVYPSVEILPDGYSTRDILVRETYVR